MGLANRPGGCEDAVFHWAKRPLDCGVVVFEELTSSAFTTGPIFVADNHGKSVEAEPKRLVDGAAVTFGAGKRPANDGGPADEPNNEFEAGARVDEPKRPADGDVDGVIEPKVSFRADVSVVFGKRSKLEAGLSVFPERAGKF